LVFRSADSADRAAAQSKDLRFVPEGCHLVQRTADPSPG
jgi:hypothetical protein